MSYEHRSNIRKRRFPAPLKIVAITAVLLFVVNFFAPQFLSSFFTSLMRPFWASEKLSEISVELENATIVELQKENRELKLALNRSATSSMTVAFILKKPPFSAYDIYIIDTGSADNVKKGDRVYAVGNILLGEIVEVSRNSSKVKLYSSYGEKYEILIGKNIQATAQGLGGGAFEVVLPRDTLVVEHDIVTVLAMDISVLGIVRRVIIDPAKNFSTVLFSQPINIYEQRVVLVEKLK